MNAVNPLRKSLLKVNLQATTLTDIEAQEITLGPGQVGGLHLHPCPVTGYIVSGQAVMQVEGEEELILNAGEVFYEPKDRHIIKFGNFSATQPLVFIAYYLLNGKQDLIRML